MAAERGRARRLRSVLWDLRLTLLAFAVVTALGVCGTVLVRATLLKNAQDTGTALSHSCAAEESDNLTMYQTLLSFGSAMIERRAEEGADGPELESWLQTYFQRVDQVLGSGVVDPYAVLDGRIVAANPWEGDDSYDVDSSPWYQLALEAGGQVVFTDVYTDVISGKPVITAALYCPRSGAVIAFDILPEHFQFDGMELMEGDSFYLCDGQGVPIFYETGLELGEEEIAAYLSGVIARIEAGEFEQYDSSIPDLKGGRPRAVYYTRMDNGWYAIVTMPYSNILGDLNGFILLFGLVIGLSFLALVVVNWRDIGLKSQAERASETVRALGNTYYALYRVNFENETYEMIKGSEYVSSQIPSKGPYSELLRVALEVIEPEVAQDFAQSFSCANISRLVRQDVRDFGGEFLRRFGEEYRWVSVRVLFDASLSSQEAVLSFREVEAEKRRQLQERRLLEDSLRLARQNEASKQSFFSSMSHDMRTPLNAILGMAELASQRLEDRDQAARCLEKIQSSGRYLLGLINDILDMSRMEQGKFILDNRQFDLRECVEECLENFRLQAQREGKALEESFQAADTLLIGDAFRVQQILNNLLSNALKFTPQGGRVSLSVEQAGAGEVAQYKFVVADTGIGMSPEFLKRLFEPYARELRFSARQAEGTGLGMSITKNLVSQMEGEIHVESQPGKGTAFTVLLPFAPAREAPAREPAPAAPAKAFALQGARLLLAEDNDLNREIAAELLAARGVAVQEAVNGKEAVEVFQQSPPFSFDAVLMDMQMPELDGCGAARAIRALDRPDAKSVPIVAVTANAFAEDMAATAAAGMNGHVVKPIDYDALERLLEKLCAGRGAP